MYFRLIVVGKHLIVEEAASHLRELCKAHISQEGCFREIFFLGIYQSTSHILHYLAICSSAFVLGEVARGKKRKNDPVTKNWEGCSSRRRSSLLMHQESVALCLGVVSPASSGIGGGAFMLLRLANGTTEAFDMRETAPMKASKVEKNFTDVVFSFLHYIKQSYLSGLGPRQLIQVLFMVLFHQLSSLVFICMTTS
ncbi:Glutathione hydrolase 2 [Camellia lanceoleosa]|uniref:Glutathione hydrolase 2 n=1 Tax=Camellia lanceoleosa TaxID=1840588 RepID=A0ACC0G7Y4_9ERIC|nr:Glutathione hydrolase 2 [Camellia lanceoleosa]